MSKLTWLHLSDLHFRAEEQHTWDSNIVLKQLLADIAERMKQDGLCPDFIVVTGDIAFSGQPAEYDLARAFFDELLQTTRLDKERLFFVPGNHDVDRNLVSRGAQGIADSLADRQSVNAVLSDPTDRALMLARFQGYADFVNDYLNEYQPFDAKGEGYFYVRTLALAECRVALLGLNSAWISASDEDKAKGLLLGERQVRTALARAADADLRIALLHHPFDWLRTFDRNDAESLLCRECDFVLHGHMHRTDLLQARTPDAEAMMIAAGASYAGRTPRNCYNLVHLDLATNVGIVSLRRYSDERGGFWAKDTLSYRNVPDGAYIFYLGGTPTPCLRPGAPFQAPSVPRWFVPRLEESQPLVDYLLAEAPAGACAGALVVSAVHGLGGIGKTTLVAAMAHSPEVQARFSDGVLWATLGQEAEPLLRLQEWIQALGDHQFHPTTEDGASAHLCTLLHDRACLLVVDDAWQTKHVRPFLVGGDRCRVVITTRDAGLARKVGAGLCDLDVMTEAQALALFETRLGPLNGNREQAAALARELGYLPLALELAAAQIEGGYPWRDLLDAFRQRAANLAALDLDEASYRNESMRLSFRLSLDPLSEEDRQAFAWLGVLPEDTHLNPAMAATLWDQPESDAGQRLRRLRDRALLKSATADRYSIHDLLHDEAVLRLAEQMALPEAHVALLERYRARTREGLWHTLPDDGYIHEHLAWHMEQAGRDNEVDTLLSEETPEGRNGWFEARERLGQTAGYLADLQRGWRLARRWHLPGIECRYALLISSLNSLASRIPPGLLEVLIEDGVWSLPQGLAYALQIPYPSNRFTVLAALVSRLPEAERHVVLGEALAAARGVGDGWYLARALKALAPHLPEALLGEALTAARGIRDEYDRAWALANLAPHLPEALLGEALAAARGIGEEWYGAWALAALVPHLAEAERRVVLGEALAAARGIGDEEIQAEVLAALAPHLPEALMGEALAAARGIGYGLDRARALADLTPHLPEAERGAVLGEALAAARGIGDNHFRAWALADLVPHLQEAERRAVLGEALAVARGIGEEGPRSLALADLVPHLPEADRRVVVDEALVAARGIRTEEVRAGRLADLVPHLPEAERDAVVGEALAAARVIGDKGNRAAVLGALAPHLPEVLVGEALAAVWGIGEEQDRAKTLAALAPHLPEALLGEALAAARGIGNAGSRAEALADLAPHLPEALVGEALAAARGIGNKHSRAKALVALAPHLAEAERGTVLGEALTAVRGIGDAYSRAEALADLAPHLPEALMGEALAAARGIGEEGRRAWALAALAPHLPEAPLGEALAAARGIGEEQHRARALADLAPHLPEPLLGEALAAARGIRDEYCRTWALADLVPHLPEADRRVVVGEALVAARGIRNEEVRAKALADLASHLPEAERDAVLGEALAAAQVIGDEGNRAVELADLASHLPEAERGAVLSEALAAARGIGDEENRAWALADLAPYLPEADRRVVLGEALIAARGIGDELDRSPALANLAPHLPEALLGEALAVAQGIGDADSRARALAALIPGLTALPPQLLYQTWDATLPALASRTRSDLLSDLGILEPTIFALGGQDAVVETFRAIQDVGRWWP